MMTGEISFDTLKTYEPDRYYAALLAPKVHREDVLAVVGFAAELRRIACHVSEPLLGAIRLQWWHDALHDWHPDKLTGSPAADAFARVMQDRQLPRAVLDRVIDGAMALQTGAAIGDCTKSVAQFSTLEGGLFALLALVLDDSRRDCISRAATPAGAAYGLARCLFDQMTSASGGAIAADGAALLGLRDEALTQLEMARTAVADIKGPARMAFLPLALVEPYLRVVAPQIIKQERKTTHLRLSPLRRMWLIWRWHLRG